VPTVGDSLHRGSYHSREGDTFTIEDWGEVGAPFRLHYAGTMEGTSAGDLSYLYDNDVTVRAVRAPCSVEPIACGD